MATVPVVLAAAAAAASSPRAAPFFSFPRSRWAIGLGAGLDRETARRSSPPGGPERPNEEKRRPLAHRVADRRRGADPGAVSGCGAERVVLVGTAPPPSPTSLTVRGAVSDQSGSSIFESSLSCPFYFNARMQ